MKRRRQTVLRVYPSKGNPFHEKVCAVVAALESEGMSQSEAVMHLLQLQVLSYNEKRIAGLAPCRQHASEYNAVTASAKGASRIEIPAPARASVAIPDSSADRRLDDSNTSITPSQRQSGSATSQRDEASTPQASKLLSLGVSTKRANDG
jgi:hypothetical protein